MFVFGGVGWKSPVAYLTVPQGLTFFPCMVASFTTRAIKAKHFFGKQTEGLGPVKIPLCLLFDYRNWESSQSPATVGRVLTQSEQTTARQTLSR